MTNLIFNIAQPTAEEMAKFEEQNLYRQRADDRRDERERKRRVELERRKTAIERALKAYRKFDDPDVIDLRIRTGFIQTTDARRTAPSLEPYSLAAEVESRPPMTRLVERRRHSLQLLMTMIFVARIETSPGQRFLNRHPNISPKHGQESWLTLAGLKDEATLDKRRGQRRMFNTAIDGLLAHDLAALEGTAGKSGRYHGFSLQTEDGSSTPYSVPGDGTTRRDAITLSTEFFRQGWHLVLTDHEMVTLLAIIDRTGYLRQAKRSGTVEDIGVDLKKAVRYATYGISDEAYNSVHMLFRFGLITLIDPMPNRRNPVKLTPLTVSASADNDMADTAEEEKNEDNERVPYRLIYPSATPGIQQFRPALETVLDTLTQ